MSHNSMLPDKDSFLRRSIMGKYLSNPIDTLDFYDFVSSLHWVPLLGNPLLRMIMNHYAYRFHSGTIAPPAAVREIFDSATEISASECACRVRAGKCDYSTRTCIKVNSGAKSQKDAGALYSETITAEEAKAITDKAHADGLLLTVEWCVAPYVYTVCCCCPCCCLARKLKFERHIEGAMFPSEYLPSHAADKCELCGECVKACPADAIVLQRRAFTLHEKKCVGCGHCARVCPNGAIEMKKSRASAVPSAGMAAFVYVSSYVILFPMVFIFIFFKGRRRRARDCDWPGHSHDHEHEHTHSD